MRRIFFASLFLSFNFYFSQSTVLHNLNHNRLMSSALSKIGNNELNDNDYIGSPYLEKSFLPSTIKGEKGIHLLRYNIYNDEIILQRGDEYFEIPKTDLEYFSIDDKYIVRLVNGTYYVQISKEVNGYTILKKDKIKFTQGKISENGYGQNSPSKFTNLKPEYFLYKTDDKNLIPIKKEDLKQKFPKKGNQLDQVFKKNKFKNENEFDDILNIIIS